MKKIKKLLTIGLAILLTFCISVSFVACSNDPNDYTVEEHIQRISDRIRARDFTSQYPYGLTYEDFEVYPVYNENEKINYYLIELEPYGFVFVRVREKPSFLTAIIFRPSMYLLLDAYTENHPWSPYVVNEPKEDYNLYDDIEWLLDEKGERIYYAKSPYYVTNNINEKKYLLDAGSCYGICAIKKDGDFINLISGQKINNIREENLYKTQAVLECSSPPKPSFYL